MVTKTNAAAFTAGALCANSLAHLATAATGRRFLTPLTGRDSNRVVNGIWGASNLVGGLVLIRGVAGGSGRWDARLVAFNFGAATFAAWMAGSERILKINWDDKPSR
jgi:hypothetical protein